MLDSLRDLSDMSTRQRCEQRHARLDEETRLLQDSAELEHRRLRRVISQWTEFAGIFAVERDRLSKLVGRQQRAFAAARSNTATLHELQSVSEEYRDLQQSVADRKAVVMQV